MEEKKRKATKEIEAAPTMSAFRAAEKKYKLYKKSQTDFTDVIDFANLSANTPKNSTRIMEVSKDIFTISDKEGCVQQQNDLLKDSTSLGTVFQWKSSSIG